MQNSSVYPDHLSVLSRALLCFFPTTFLETAVYSACPFRPGEGRGVIRGGGKAKLKLGWVKFFKLHLVSYQREMITN